MGFLHFSLPGRAGALSSPHQFPLNLPATATYGSTLTVNGTDGSSVAGNVVAVGRWNGGPPTTLASGVVTADHSWSMPIPMTQQGSLALTIELPSGNTLVGGLTVRP